MLLGKNKLNTSKVLISKTLIDLYISHYEFVSVNNVIKENNWIKEDTNKFCDKHYKNMVRISRKTYKRNDIETIVDKDGILRLNEKYTEERLDHKNWQEITIKYYSDHRKHSHELGEGPKKQCNRIFVSKKLAIKVIMDPRTTSAHSFRTRLRFKQYVILTKEQ